MSSNEQSTGALLDIISDSDEGRKRVKVGTLLRAIGSRGVGAFIMLPALIDLSPIGGIPGVPTFFAVLIFLICIQILFGLEHMWFPNWIEQRSISAQRLENAVQYLRPVGRFFDRWFHRRYEFLVKGPFMRATAIACITLCLFIPPLEIVPFGATLPMLAFFAFGGAILAQDGILNIIAWCFWLIAIGSIYLLLG